MQRGSETDELGRSGWPGLIKSLAAAQHDDFYRRVCREVAEGFGLSRVMIATVDEARASLIGRGGYDPSLEAPLYGALLRLYRVRLDPDANGKLAVAAWCVRHAEQVHIPDAARYAFRPKETKQITLLVKAMGTNEYVLTPIKYRGRSVGIVAADKKGQSERIGPADLTVLRDIADAIGLALGPMLGHGSTPAPPAPLPAEPDPTAKAYTHATTDPRLVAELLNTMQEGVLLADAEQRIVFANLQAVAMLEVYPWHLSGRSLQEVLPASATKRLSSGPPPGEEWTDTASIRTASGQVKRLRIRFTWLQRGDEDVIAVFLAKPDADGLFEGMRGSVLSMLLHELKAPLQSVIGFAELLRLGRLGEANADQMEFLSRIEESGTLVLQRVNRIVELGRFDPEPKAVSLETVNVAGLIEGVVRRLGGKAMMAQVDVTTELQPELPTIVADRSLLTEVVQNLVDNAIMASAVGGWVQVRARLDGAEAERRVRLDVRNEGGRMSHPIRSDPDAERGEHSDPPGWGVGLRIAREIVEAHGGEIWMEGDPSEGVAVSLALPLMHGGTGESVA